MLNIRTALLVGFFILAMTGCSKSQNVLDEDTYTIIGEAQKGNSIFPSDILQDITKMVLWEYDDVYYEISNSDVLLEVGSSLLGLDYIEIENPWLEGGKFLNIYSGENIYEIWISSDVISFDNKVYHVSEESLGKQLLEIFIENGQKRNNKNVK